MTISGEIAGCADDKRFNSHVCAFASQSENSWCLTRSCQRWCPRFLARSRRVALS